MGLGQKLQVIREHQPTRWTRERAAAEISRMFQISFNATKVKHLELERSKKHLNVYRDFAVRAWGADPAELASDEFTGLQVASPVIREATANYNYNLLPVYIGRPHPSGEPDLAFTQSEEWVKTHLVLPDGPRDYIALKAFSNSLHPFVTHGATVIVRRSAVPPSGSYVLLHQDGLLHLRGFVYDGPDALLYRINPGVPVETKSDRHKIVGYVVAVIHEPIGSLPNVVYHEGNAIPYRVPAHLKASVG